MLSVLLKKQLTEIFRNYFYNPKTNKARSKAAVAAYIVLFAVLMVVILGGMFTVLSAALCTPLTAAGLDWLYFALMALLATLLGAFGSVFNTYSGLYLAKDNDLLLSMPIPVNTLMASRLLGVYLMGLMYSGVVMLPAVIVYWVATPAPAAAVIGGVLLVFLLSVFVLALSCALGWLVAKISQKLKNKSFITMLVSLAFIGAYYFFYAKAGDLLRELLANAALYGDTIRSGAYPLYLVGRVAVGDAGAIAIVAAVTLGVFALVWYLIARSFLRLATSTGAVAKVVYRERAVGLHSPDRALLGRELRRFTASANYMLNCGMGILGMAVAAVALIWKGRDFLGAVSLVLPVDTETVSVLLCAAVCALISMNDMAAPSVSLEGKSLWLAQSLPVTAWQVLRAKLRMHLLLTAVPGAVLGVCLAAVCDFPAVQMAAVLALAAVFLVFSALLNLALGLKMPNLHWTSEITPIKQGGAVAIALLGGWAYAAAMAVLYFMVGRHMGFAAYMAAFLALTLAAAVLLYIWVRKKGCAIFASL